MSKFHRQRSGRLGRCWMALFSGAMFVLICLAGCYHPPGTPKGDPYGHIPSITYAERVRWYHEILFWTMPLPRKVPIRLVRLERLPTGSLRAIVEIRNNTKEQLRIDYQTWFLDENGVMVEERSPWTLVILEPLIEKQLIFNSINPAASRFRMHVRQAD